MISKQEVKHIADLARLGLTQKELERMQKDLSLVLDYFNLLKAIDIENVEPTFHSISNLEISLRKDEAKKESLEEIAKLRGQAPEKEDRYIKVKEIL